MHLIVLVFYIQIVGHSLGGGTAALLTYILREQKEFSSSTCVTFAPGMYWSMMLNFFFLIYIFFPVTTNYDQCAHLAIFSFCGIVLVNYLHWSQSDVDFKLKMTLKVSGFCFNCKFLQSIRLRMEVEVSRLYFRETGKILVPIRVYF